MAVANLASLLHFDDFVMVLCVLSAPLQVHDHLTEKRAQDT